MCGISGCYAVNGKVDIKYLAEIIANTKERGRDSFGIAIKGEKGVTVFKTADRDFIVNLTSQQVEEILKKLEKNAGGIKWCIVNFRAEPTTEYIEVKTSDDIQPFNSGDVWVVHNGTIANDVELSEKYNLKPKSKIDTAVLTEYLAKMWDGSFEELRRILVDDIIGSYALAIVKKDNFFLATNYKPLYIAFKDGVYYFASLREHLMPYDKERTISNLEFYIKNKLYLEEIKPYTLIMLGKKPREVSLWKKNTTEKILVICSGGLDSTTVATKYVREGKRVTLLYFMYGCKAEKKELEAVKKIAEYLKCNYIVVDVRKVFKEVIKHSPLLDENAEIVRDREGIAGAEFAFEWVPARNLIMLSIAVGIAEAYGYDVVALGNNLEESGSYPDNEYIFTYKFDLVLPHATNLQNRVKVEMPVAHLMKHEIVALGLKLKAPYHLTWSCYEGNDKHCGKCGPCYMRRMAFKINGVIDPALAHFKPEFWKGCRPFDDIISKRTND